MIGVQRKPLAMSLVRKVFSIYLALAVILTLFQIGIEYRSTHATVLAELDSAALAFKPGVASALWNYQHALLDSIARGMVNGGIVTGVDIGDTPRHLRVIQSRDGEPLDRQGLSKHIELFHVHSGAVREPIGYMTLYSTHGIVVERLVPGVVLIVIGAAIKTVGLWLIIVCVAERLLAGPLRRFSGQLASFDLSKATEAPRIEVDKTASAELASLSDSFNDLTQRAIANNQLVLQKEAAEAANVAKSRFLAAASHDLRQPMHAINLYLATLAALDLRKQADKADELLVKARQCGRTMDEMFRALLDMSRLDASYVKPEIDSFAIATVLEHIRLQFEPQARAKGLTLRVAPCSLTVKSDATMVERILRNFVCNAVRYTERGKILIGCRRRGARLQVAVYDTGIGIPEDKHRAVFEEFLQLGNPERDREKGLGLGLAIVERLAKLLDAPISLVSAPGRGSMFAVDLPRGNPTESPALVPAPMQFLQIAKPNQFDGLCVVVIDDDVSILDATHALLERWGCTPITATSSEEAISRLTSTARIPEVLICDYRLSAKENGIAAVKALRAEFGETVPALLITGDTAPDGIRNIRASDLAVLHKPVDEGSLRRTLLQLCE